MIVHFMFDEKIINSLIDNFERVSAGRNLYIVFNERGSKDLSHVALRENIHVFDRKKDDINAVLRDVNIEAIVCHILNIEFAETILKIDRPVNIYWSVWGYDVYSMARIKPSLYAPLTLKYIKKEEKLQPLLWYIYKHPFIRKICYLAAGKQDPYARLEKVQSRVKACLTYMKEDVDVLKKYYPNLNMGYIYFPFLTLRQYLGSHFSDITATGKNILIGNSNSETSNHMDAFDLLSKAGLQDIKIFVPLSYGGKDSYKQAVIRSGKKLLGEQFVPMTDFIALQEYIKILSSCSVGIFYHYRQQGMGNILAMLWMGARIYMSSKNPAFIYLTRIGIRVFSLETEFRKYRNTALDQKDIISNRTVLASLFSASEVEKQYQNVVNIITTANVSL